MRLLRRIRDFAAVQGWAEVNAATADAALLRLEVDARGLDAMTAAILAASPRITAAGQSGSRRWRRRSAISAT